MRLAPLILALVFAAGPLAKAQTSSASNSAARPRVIEMRIGDEIEPIMAEYIDGGISEAARQHASLILITMDTPGGLGTSMEDMIQHILSSSVPVVVYVSPAGARGASAVFFMLLSADVAAMAPGTHAGAASPLLAEALTRLRKGEVIRQAGYDGEYGVIRLFEARELDRLTTGDVLFDAPVARKKKPVWNQQKSPWSRKSRSKPAPERASVTSRWTRRRRTPLHPEDSRQSALC